MGNMAFNFIEKTEIFLSIDRICYRSDFFSTFDNYGNLSLCQDNDFSDYANKGSKEWKNIENYLMILIKFHFEMVHNRKEDILSTL